MGGTIARGGETCNVRGCTGKFEGKLDQKEEWNFFLKYDNLGPPKKK